MNKSWDWSESKRYRNWFFTCNNYTDDDYDLFKSLVDEGKKPKCTYVAISKEVGELRGTAHLHALAYFHDAHFHKVIRKKFPRCWMEPTYPKSTLKHQLEYITKTGKYAKENVPTSELEEFGDRPNEDPNHGRKKGGDTNADKWERTRALAREGRLDEIDAQHYITFYPGLKRIAADNAPLPTELPDNSRKVCFEWWFGDPGTGKSRTAKDTLIEEFGEFYDKPPHTKWADGCTGPNVPWRINDVDPSAKSLVGLFKLWAEEAPYYADVKNSGMWCRPPKVIVTSNYSPMDIWHEYPKDLAAIVDRYKIVWWPKNYYEGMPKGHPWIDEIHPPYVKPVEPPHTPVPMPVLSRTANTSSFANGNFCIFATEEIAPISDEENRANIHRWIQEFDHDFEAPTSAPTNLASCASNFNLN